MTATVKPTQQARTSILNAASPTAPRTTGFVGSKEAAFSNELHPVPPLHLDAQESTPERLQKQFMDAFETLRRATLPMRQNPASAPCHSRGVISRGTPTSPQILLVPHALGRPHTGAHVTQHTGTPFSGTETTTGSVAYISVTSGGSGYTTPPKVLVSGAGGSGAQAEAVLQDGKVAYIKVTSAGTGHTGSPNVSITGGGGTGALAKAVLPPTFDPTKYAQFVTTSTGTYSFQLFGD
jgi:hypothetical protein